MADGASAPKLDLFGVGVSSTDYADSVGRILDHARARQPLGVAALATHGLMLGATDPTFAAVLERIDLVTPDGQPVRFALNRLHGAGLSDRVYGPELTTRVCAAAATAGLSVFLFGSTAPTCAQLATALRRDHPGLVIAGVQPDRFREPTTAEDEADVAAILASGADFVLVGRGCPRQERWVSAHRDRLPVPLLAVGAAFDYLAGTLRVPPQWMQVAGLEWLHRLGQEPGRLWRRYLFSNTWFVAYFVRAWCLQVGRRRRRRPSPPTVRP